MFDARSAVDMLVNSDKLDGLLAAARKQAAATAPAAPVSAESELARLATETDEVTAASKKASEGLKESIAEREARREVKVATVRHMLHVMSSLDG
jgi:hypothetical protein